MYLRIVVVSSILITALFFLGPNPLEYNFLLAESNKNLLADSNKNSPQDKEILDIAIVGGGISGAYCAWRLMSDDSPLLKKKTKPSIHLYEKSSRVGGRLYTIFFQGMPHVPVELGAEKFSETDLLTHGISTKLELDLEEFPDVFSDNFAYLRGKRLRISSLTNEREVPYQLSPQEEGKSPHDLILYAVDKLIPGVQNMTEEEWNEKKGNLKFQDKNLDEVSWQNFLLASLGTEAFQFLIDTQTLSLLYNTSAKEQISNLFKPASIKKYRFTKGFQELAKKLVKDFEKKGGEFHSNYSLEGIYLEKTETESFFRLKFRYLIEDSYVINVFAKKVILAIPKKALESLDEESILFKDEKFQDNLDSLLPVHQTKLYLAYTNAWWKELGLQSGSSVSDTPLGRTTYYGSERDAKNGETDNTNSLLLASCDGIVLPYWQAFASGEEYEGLPNPHIPLGKNSRNKSTPASTYIVFQAQKFLGAIHGLKDIPNPYSAAYFDWSKGSYGGAYYKWKIGADVDALVKELRHPASDLALYISGCTFSKNQGSVEGALKSAEAILQEFFKLEPPPWQPEKYN